MTNLSGQEFVSIHQCRSELTKRGNIILVTKDRLSSLCKTFLDNQQTLAIVGDEVGFNELRGILLNDSVDTSFTTINSNTGDIELVKEIRTEKLDGILMVGGFNDWLEAIRTIAFKADYQGPIYIVGPENRECRPMPFECPLPIVAYCFPCAGTMRFCPQLYFMLERLRFRHAVCRDLTVNTRYQYLHGRSASIAQARAEEEQLVRGIVSGFDYYEYSHVHAPINLQSMIGTLCQWVVLLRDPRDILTSYYYHVYEELSGTPEERLIYLMKGYRRTLGFNSYSLLWPNVTELCNFFLPAVENSEFISVKFEDLHNDEIGTLKRLMTQLGLYPHPLINLDEAFFQEAALQGSIEFQTQGKRKRGEGHTKPLWGNSKGATSRNGVVGDWRKLFTQGAVDYFKEKTGDALVRLGYEKDKDWGI